MEIKQIKVKDLVPYENNPRNNDEAVSYVMNSIREFGFKVPLVVDKENVIVCGHTRYLACIKLGIEEVPCVIADDLSEEQIKAFRLADNKVSEIAEWDLDLLSIELDDVCDIDMTMFGFLDEEPQEEKTKERDDLSNDVAETFEVIIECTDELQQEEIFLRLQKKGLKCRVLTL